MTKPRIFRAIYRSHVGCEWACRSNGAIGLGSTPQEAYERWKSAYWEPAEQFGKAIGVAFEGAKNWQVKR